ncbi:MAG: endonuclease domain-containing protein, partial [Acidimicrobiia bacterium]|nr:endonuclease domain-containing protein [Acidimicrobiia bacterium]
TTVAITVPIRRTHRFHSVVVHQSTDLDPAQTLTIKGIAVTDVCRTVIDLATELRPTALGDLVDQAVQLKLTGYEILRKRLEMLARRGKPGVVRLRKVLEQRSDTPVVIESVLELRLLRILTVRGLPMPDTQFRPSWLRTVSGRVDVAYVTERVIVEADSRRWHNSPEAFQADRERDNLAQLAGWTILRYTWEDVTRRPEYVAATVRGALNRSRRV